MARRAPAPKKGKKSEDGKGSKAYEHPEEKLLLRPDVGLQAQFKPKKPSRTYRYDPSLDPGLSWDINADRERAEALIARVEQAEDLEEAKAAATELRRMSRPFLNWAGKAERVEFAVPTLPLFVHERLSTQAILQSLRSHKRDRQQTLAFFADEELDVADRLLKAYEHETNWVNRLILGDSLVVMNSLLQYEGLGGQVQMIYMDPPYGVKFGSNFQPFIRRRDVKHGDDEDLTREPEMVQAYRDTWELGLHSYLTYLRDRLLLCRELLHPSGSIIVQISDENLHHVRELLDEIFGDANFVSQISFRTKIPLRTTLLANVHDFALWYAKSKDRLKFRKLFIPKQIGDEGRFNLIELADGTRRHMTAEESSMRSALPSGARAFVAENLNSAGRTESCVFDFEFRSKVFRPTRGKSWKTNLAGMRGLAEARRCHIAVDPLPDL